MWSWNGGEPLTWTDCVKIILACCYLGLSDPVRLSPIIYKQTTALCLWGVKRTSTAERWAACLRGSEGEGEEEREVFGRWREGVKIHYIYTDCLPGWLFIRNCKSFPLHLALLPSPSPPPSSLLSTPPVLSADSEMITTGQNTRLKMTKTHTHRQRLS